MCTVCALLANANGAFSAGVHVILNCTRLSLPVPLSLLSLPFLFLLLPTTPPTLPILFSQPLCSCYHMCLITLTGMLYTRHTFHYFVMCSGYLQLKQKKQEREYIVHDTCQMGHVSKGINTIRI